LQGVDRSNRRSTIGDSAKVLLRILGIKAKLLAIIGDLACKGLVVASLLVVFFVFYGPALISEKKNEQNSQGNSQQQESE